MKNKNGIKVKCEIKRNEQGGYHVYFNKIDVAKYIRKMQLDISGTGIPEIVLYIPIGEFSIDEETLISVIQYGETG